MTQAQYPMYLALGGGSTSQTGAASTGVVVPEGGLGYGHGAGAVNRAVYSYMRWRHPDIFFTDYRIEQQDNVGDMRGRSLMIGRGGGCGGIGQYGAAYNGMTCTGPTGDSLMIRSENQVQVDGYSKMQVFVPSPSVSVSNVQTHSAHAYSAEPITLHQPYYIDRQYQITDLPDYMHGLWGVKTANDDKNSDPTDLEYLCFDISHKAVVYVLYDTRATDRPTWLKTTFTDQDIAVVGHTDVNMGHMETYYHVFNPGQVCLGGNDAPGVGSMYLVLVGPMHNLAQHPSHRVDIQNLDTHVTTGTPYRITDIGAGDTVYVDRTVRFHQLPPFLHGLNSIKTGNDEESVLASGDDESWICFDVTEPVRIYLLYDPSIVAAGLPAWVRESFTDSHEETATAGHGYGYGGQETADVHDNYEILSGRFPAGHICLGGNGAPDPHSAAWQPDPATGCTGYNAHSRCSDRMYVPFIGPELEVDFQPGSAGASARYFDGDSDYVLLPRMDGRGKHPKRSFEEITIDCWVRIFDMSTPHPIMNEDHWDEGDMHYQFWPCDADGGGYCRGQQGMLIHAVHGNTMQPNRYGHTQVEYSWQPMTNQWYYLSAVYSTKAHYHKLYVNGVLQETVSDPAVVTPVTLDSARIGSWLDPSDSIARSLHGEISVFRIWNVETDGQDVCPPAQTAGLVASYVFGHSGDTLLDLSGNSYDGQIHDADWSDDLPPSQQCQRQGFGGYFDGDQDYVQMNALNKRGQPLGDLEALSIDVWVKFSEISGDHPIFMEDGWEPGAMHLQLYQGKFDLSINGVGDFIFSWQPLVDEWYFIEVVYQSGTQPGGQQLCSGQGCVAGSIGLRVDTTMDGETNAYMHGDTPSNLAVGGMQNGEPADGGTPCTGYPACDINGPPIHLNSPRIGAWDYDADGNMDRSMRGQIAVFRLWDTIKNGEDRCVPSGPAHLIVSYLFDSFNDVLKDRSGNGNDAVLHDNKFSADYPNSQCIYNGANLAAMADPVVVGQHGTVTVGCSDCEGANEPQGAHQPPVEVNLNEAFTNPVIIAGVPTENGADSAVIRIQNLRRLGEVAQSGINIGSAQYGDNCDGSDCGHSGRCANTRSNALSHVQMLTLPGHT